MDSIKKAHRFGIHTHARARENFQERTTRRKKHFLLRKVLCTMQRTQDAVIWSDTGKAHAGRFMNRGNFGNEAGIDQRRGHFLIRGQHHAVLCGNGECRATIGHGIERVFQRQQFARAGKGGQTKTVRRVCHIQRLSWCVCTAKTTVCVWTIRNHRVSFSRVFGTMAIRTERYFSATRT
jgi:hypothetical protein